jgi:hypothetical protein
VPVPPAVRPNVFGISHSAAGRHSLTTTGDAGPDDRATRLRELADEVCEHAAVTDAWLAKSFTHRLFVVDLEPDADLPDAVAERLAENDLYGANEVYDVDEVAGSFAGAVADANRHQFVDVRTRGDHRSYVLD